MSLGPGRVHFQGRDQSGVGLGSPAAAVGWPNIAVARPSTAIAIDPFVIAVTWQPFCRRLAYCHGESLH